MNFFLKFSRRVVEDADPYMGYLNGVIGGGMPPTLQLEFHTPSLDKRPVERAQWRDLTAAPKNEMSAATRRKTKDGGSLHRLSGLCRLSVGL